MLASLDQINDRSFKDPVFRRAEICSSENGPFFSSEMAANQSLFSKPLSITDSGIRRQAQCICQVHAIAYESVTFITVFCEATLVPPRPSVYAPQRGARIIFNVP